MPEKTQCTIQVFKVHTLREMQEAWRIRNVVFVQGQGISLEGELDGLDDQADHWLAFCTTHGPVGTIRLVEHAAQEGTCKFGRLAVLPSHRGTGVGKALMRAMHDVTEVQGRYRTIMCHAQQDKIGFYQSLGYELLPGDTFYQERIPHRKMRKLILSQVDKSI
ncbi:acyl-CoA N-acyltransferase [Piptocephalis cylindrospora]|uniref:Acyl-CoA N-acyltransferase n=1 Tax=Piptocephalis cylindrospora TaxID=1907219 RepID=A0A4P9XZ02_9FUNG|nr:acyl-CoA N-acyltransferase [Piptocephalis cylindrospora]|eukprot:RKP11686.1 acyl-CoA N-acyltransferase [Piptocephalis cylindrospora]